MNWKKHAKEHADAEFPRESCGVLVQTRFRAEYCPCRNISKHDGNFEIDPLDYMAATKMGEIVGVVHSHPRGPRGLTDTDLEWMRKGRVPWWVYDYLSGTWVSADPTEEPLKYRGIRYSFGEHDCGSIVCDFYREEFGIELPRVECSGPHFWTTGLETPYEDSLAETPFYEIPKSEIRFGDLALMKTLGSKVINHAAIVISPNLILHHAYGKLSSVVAYSERFERETAFCVRHPDVCEMLSSRRAGAFVRAAGHGALSGGYPV